MGARKHWRKLILIPALLIISRLPAGADDIFDLKVNQDYYLTDQTNPSIAVGQTGRFVVVWADNRNGLSEIYYQFVDSTGQLLGENGKLGEADTFWPQFTPVADANIFGQYGVVWKDYRNGSYPFNPDIYFAYLDSSGAGENMSVTGSRADSSCTAPDIAVLGNGNMVVVWADYRNKNWDIYGQRLNEYGYPIGVNFRVNSDTGPNQQHSPGAAALAGDNFIVVWYDNRNGDDDIYGQLFDAAGNKINGEFRVNDDITTKKQAFPAVTADGNGRFFVAWVDWRNGAYPVNPDIYLRRYDDQGLPIDSSVRINPSSDQSPQRDVSLCSDRMGNLAVVWADSTNGQWDAWGRIVDCQGNLEENSFIIHENTQGRQLSPDVATDGYKLFFTWADSRSGDFDIYVSIREYNDPTIVAEPSSIAFTMEQFGELPAEKKIFLKNTGYGELNWRATGAAGWLAVSPDSGQTPDTITLSIAADTLPYGSYNTQLRLTDLDHGDSTAVVGVSLVVTAPILALTPDTLSFRVLAELGNPSPESLLVGNTGTGILTWTASENSEWFAINPASGDQGDYLRVIPDVGGLNYGDYLGEVVVVSAEAVNSPETVMIALELVGNMPFLGANPDSIVIEASRGEVASAGVEILNLGSGMLDWTAVEDEDYLVLDRYAGTDYDTINITVETAGLDYGTYQAVVNIFDSASFNKSVDLNVELRVLADDTLRIFDADAMTGGTAVVPVYLDIGRPVKAAFIPLGYDTSLAALDSAEGNVAGFPGYVDIMTSIAEDGVCLIGLRINDVCFADSSLPSGCYNAASLYFTAGDSEGACTIDTTSTDTASVYVLDENLNQYSPVVVPGELHVGFSSHVDDNGPAARPGCLSLGQNYPNPFNSRTAFDFFIPEEMHATLTIYNILGQKVAEIFDGTIAPGAGSFRWDGRMNGSREAPSGVYFYRFDSEAGSIVRKMVLIK